MKIDHRIGASDNELKIDSIKFFLGKLKEFEENKELPAQTKEELTIILPDGFMREADEANLINRAVFFDLIYSKRRLRFAIEIGKKSAIKEFFIELALSNPATGFNSFIINQRLQMTVEDIRQFVYQLGQFFQPRFYQVKTTRDENYIPKEYLALRDEEKPDSILQ